MGQVCNRKDFNFIVGVVVFLLLLFVMLTSNMVYAQLSENQAFLTKSKPYLQAANPENTSLKPIITANDTLPSGYIFQRIPDGLGIYDNGNGTVDVFVNHELEKEVEGEYAKVSNIRLNQNNVSIIDANLIINGSEGYERLCSAYLVEGYGFEHPIFFTNEEVNDGLVLAIDAINGTVTEMPWMGEFSHENTIHVPYFSNNIHKTVVLSFEDGDATESEVYMYVSNSPEDLLSGKGQLYVFGAENQTAYNTWDDIHFSNKTVSGNFIPLKWNHSIQNPTDLDNEAIAAGGFQFIRAEDGAFDKRDGSETILYMAETGSDIDENDQPIPVGSNGQNWTKGRIYKFTFTDPKDPTKASFEVIMDGNNPIASGYNVITNPDNVDTSQNSLMIQEDRIVPNRQNVTYPYDVTQNAKIIRMDLANGNLETIAYVNQTEDVSAQYGDWESSGILDVSKIFGQGSWLLDVQAHSLGEGGQLIMMNATGS
jgi:hypothetical protein